MPKLLFSSHQRTRCRLCIHVIRALKYDAVEWIFQTIETPGVQYRPRKHKMVKWRNPVTWIAPWYGCIQNVPTYPQPQQLLFAAERWNSELFHKVRWITLTTWGKARFGNFYLFNIMGGGGGVVMSCIIFQLIILKLNGCTILSI